MKCQDFVSQMTNDHSANLAKTNQPVAENILLREHLFTCLDQSRNRSVICVSAPAGAGKTTLLSSYIQEKNIPCLWYQVDGGDTDLATFFYYLGLAGNNAALGKDKVFPVFRPEHSLAIPQFSREFFAEIFRCLPPESLLVFDDFQEGGDAAPFHAALLAGLDRIPQSVTIILLSRAAPPALFSRLLANRQGTLLRWEDLRFSLDEFKAVVALWQRKDRLDDSLEDMYAKMDGWIAGLHLIMKLGDRGKPFKISVGSPQEMFDYFSFEAFSGLDEPMQNFLMRTAFISPVSVPMAQKISGDENAELILQNLHQGNYFTNKKQHREVFYHYHPLFRDFLLQQATDRLTAEELKELRYNAADLLLGANRYEEAIECLRLAENWDRLLAIILEKASILLERVE